MEGGANDNPISKRRRASDSQLVQLTSPKMLIFPHCGKSGSSRLSTAITRKKITIFIPQKHLRLAVVQNQLKLSFACLNKSVTHFVLYVTSVSTPPTCCYTLDFEPLHNLSGLAFFGGNAGLV